MKKSCEMRQVESTANSQRQIHGEVCTEVCKVAVGVFVLALVGDSLVQFGVSNYQVTKVFCS